MAFVGAVASLQSIPLSLSVAAVIIVLGVRVDWWPKLPVLNAEDLPPSLYWPHPFLNADVDVERRPVIITVDCEIDTADIEGFKAAIVEACDM